MLRQSPVPPSFDYTDGGTGDCLSIEFALYGMTQQWNADRKALATIWATVLSDAVKKGVSPGAAIDWASVPFELLSAYTSGVAQVAADRTALNFIATQYNGANCWSDGSSVATSTSSGGGGSACASYTMFVEESWDGGLTWYQIGTISGTVCA